LAIRIQVMGFFICFSSVGTDPTAAFAPRSSRAKRPTDEKVGVTGHQFNGRPDPIAKMLGRFAALDVLRGAHNFGDLLKNPAIWGGLPPDEAQLAARTGVVEAMDGDAGVAAFLVDCDLGQQGDTLPIGHELDDGGEGGRGKGAAIAIVVEATGRDCLVAKAMALIEQENA